VKSEEGYDMYAEFYDKQGSYLSSFESEKLWMILKNLKGKKILDLGCGTGRLIPILSGEIIGADVSEKMLAIAKKRFPKIKFLKEDALNLSFEDESFDAVVCAFLIVHIKDPAKLFEEVYRVIKPGGVFVLTNINQRKGPKLELNKKKTIVIQSFYHLPQHVREALKENFFTIEKEEFVYEGEVWVNQIILARKK